MKKPTRLLLVTLFTISACGDSTSQNNTKKDLGARDMGRDALRDVSIKMDVTPRSDQSASDTADLTNFGRTLNDYHRCKSDAECPVGLGQCITEVQLNRQDINGNESIPIANIIEGLDPDEGICTRICTLNDSECSGLSTNGAVQDAEPYVCQVVVVAEAPYPATPPAFPFDSTLNPQDLEDGIPFGAICRPPFQLDESVDRGFCAECVGGLACAGSAMCWNFLSQNEALDGESGTCLGQCSDAVPCPGGFSCDDLGGRNYCRPILDSCTSCVDRDKDGRGNGRCGGVDANTEYDCDDFNADSYYDVMNPNHAFPKFCAESNDFNCNGISDAVEEIGSVDFGNDHCASCFDECRGVVPNGSSECIANTCRAECTDATKWADCDGDLTNGCEQAVDDLTRIYYRDFDLDGFGDPNDALFACDPNIPPDGYVRDNTDCNDALDSIYPGAAELCDGIKQNCDNLVADENAVGEGDTCNVNGTVGACANGGTLTCMNAAGFLCEQAVLPIAETCNNIDDDCNGLADDNVLVGPRWCDDSDDDGYGDCATAIVACTFPGGTFRGYTSDMNLWDCHDGNPDIYPMRTEDCLTAADDNCNGLANDFDNGSKSNIGTFVLDADGDGYGENGANLLSQCDAPVGYSTFLGFNDCAPNDQNVNPGETETCATPLVDDNCNNDLNDAPANETTTFYLDNDGDMYGTTSKEFCGNLTPVGYAPVDGDCNDNGNNLRVVSSNRIYNANEQNPGMRERCEGFDNNCSGRIDDGCPSNFSLENVRMQGNPVGFVAGDFSDSLCDYLAGEMLMGLRVQSVDQLGLCQAAGGIYRIQARCSNPYISQDDLSDPFIYSQVRGTVFPGTVIGSAPPDLGLCNGFTKTENINCDGAERAITGINGTQRFFFGLGSLGIDCKEHAHSSPQLVNPTTITMQSAWASDVVPANFEEPNSFSESCANNEVAVGFRSYYYGGRVRSIELRCADISALNR